MKQMAWLNPTLEAPKQLYLRTSSEQPWIPYKESTEYVPDYLIPGGSAGFATQQVLMKKGWKLISSEGITLD